MAAVGGSCAIMAAMRAALTLLTALPPADAPPRAGQVWVWTPAVGAVLGACWFVVQQLTVHGVGPLVAGAAVIVVGAALTGARTARGTATTVRRLAEGGREAADLPVHGVDALVLAAAVAAEVALVQRLNLAPYLIAVVPLATCVAPVLVLREGDRMGEAVPAVRQRLAVAGGTVLALAVPVLLAPLERPARVPPTLDTVGILGLGLAALVVATQVATLAATWLRARTGGLDRAGWFALGMLAEVAAFVVVAAAIH